MSPFTGAGNVRLVRQGKLLDVRATALTRSASWPEAERGQWTWFRDCALTLVLMAMLLLFLVGQMITGLYEYNATQREHGEQVVTLIGYLTTGHPWEALFENWENEFLQMAMFVLLTTCLVQKG